MFLLRCYGLRHFCLAISHVGTLLAVDGTDQHDYTVPKLPSFPCCWASGPRTIGKMSLTLFELSALPVKKALNNKKGKEPAEPPRPFRYNQWTLVHRTFHPTCSPTTQGIMIPHISPRELW